VNYLFSVALCAVLKKKRRVKLIGGKSFLQTLSEVLKKKVKIFMYTY